MYEIDSVELSAAIAGCMPSMSDDPTRDAMYGMLLEVGAQARLVATDGHTLAIWTFDTPGVGAPRGFGVLLPYRTVHLIAYMLRSDAGVVKVGPDVCRMASGNGIVIPPPCAQYPAFDNALRLHEEEKKQPIRVAEIRFDQAKMRAIIGSYSAAYSKWWPQRRFRKSSLSVNISMGKCPRSMVAFTSIELPKLIIYAMPMAPKE